MPRRDPKRLEVRVQEIDRAHPEWSAREIAVELEALEPVAAGNWRDATPSVEARVRQIQRWRRGGTAGGTATLPYPFLWPVGELQRQGLEPTFRARTTGQRGSSRLFLYNCSPETIRDVRIRLARREVGYEPAMPPGSFAEIPWHRHEKVRNAGLAASPATILTHRLAVEFVVARGAKRARLDGKLSMNSSEGWTRFQAKDGREKEVQ